MTHKIEYWEAIKSLRPNASFAISFHDWSTLEWFDDAVKKPTLEEVEDEILRLQAEYDDKEYQRLRAPEYPPIGDQLDALFHAGVFPPEMAAKIQAVKDKYPK